MVIATTSRVQRLIDAQNRKFSHLVWLKPTYMLLLSSLDGAGIVVTGTVQQVGEICD